jgi:hypothetical protein
LRRALHGRGLRFVVDRISRAAAVMATARGAAAFLSSLTRTPPKTQKKDFKIGPFSNLIALIINEVRRLFNRVAAPLRDSIDHAW